MYEDCNYVNMFSADRMQSDKFGFRSSDLENIDMVIEALHDLVSTKFVRTVQSLQSASTLKMSLNRILLIHKNKFQMYTIYPFDQCIPPQV